MTLATYTSVLLWPAANPVHSRTWILLAPVGACRVDGLDLKQLVALVHGEQLASFRRLVERCVSQTRLRDRLLQLATMSAAPKQRAAGWAA
jgi:hypothetical protein